mmetsp:Transcript_7401/g.14758  ORF Transcript_7401/g.14758 Transcript_7401/m.14758 type:complete len:130 (+) Transcript_7401:2709-3098(+)
MQYLWLPRTAGKKQPVHRHVSSVSITTSSAASGTPPRAVASSDRDRIDLKSTSSFIAAGSGGAWWRVSSGGAQINAVAAMVEVVRRLSASEREELREGDRVKEPKINLSHGGPPIVQRRILYNTQGYLF